MSYPGFHCRNAEGDMDVPVGINCLPVFCLTGNTGKSHIADELENSQGSTNILRTCLLLLSSSILFSLQGFTISPLQH